MPDEQEITISLATSLEDIRQHDEACRVLEEDSELANTHYVGCSMLAFNSIMSGNVEKARRLLPLLQQMCGGDGPYDILPERIGGIVQRADSVAGVCSLDKFDLRGWHYVLNSSLLLILSNVGFKDGPMYGRFAFLYESYAGCRECIQRLKLVMKHLDISVPRVFFLPEVGSIIMAQALAPFPWL